MRASARNTRCVRTTASWWYSVNLKASLSPGSRAAGMSASSGNAAAIRAPCSVRNQPFARPDRGSTSSSARPCSRSLRSRLRIFSMPLSGA